MQKIIEVWEKGNCERKEIKPMKKITYLFGRFCV